MKIESKKSKRASLEDISGFILFIGLFIVFLPYLMITGAIIRPIRYFRYVFNTTLNRKVEKWYF